MQKFYVASSFRNIGAVRYVAENLKRMGYVHTYDWTKNDQMKKEKKFTLEDLKEIGQREKEAILASDLVVVIMPGGKGTHIELGIALGHGKRIILYSPNGEIDHFETTSTFYHLPKVEKCYGTLDELLKKITIEKDSFGQLSKEKGQSN